MQFLKQVPMHPRDGHAQKIKNIDNDVKFIKQVPLNPRDKLAPKTRDMYDDMKTVHYNQPPANDELLSYAESII